MRKRIFTVSAVAAIAFSGAAFAGEATKKASATSKKPVAAGAKVTWVSPNLDITLPFGAKAFNVPRNPSSAGQSFNHTPKLTPASP